MADVNAEGRALVAGETGHFSLRGTGIAPATSRGSEQTARRFRDMER